MGRSGRKYAPEILFASGGWASDRRAAVLGGCEAWAGPVTGELRVLGLCEPLGWACDGRAAVQGRGGLRVLGWCEPLGWAGLLRSLGRAGPPAPPRLIGYKPLAFRKVEASGCFIPVKSVNISMGSLVLPRLMILSRKAWPTAGSRAPCLAK